MIRTLVAGFGLAVLTACGAPAPVDLTATYARTQGSPISVKAAANGNARAEAGDYVFIRRDGVDYVVLRDARGLFSAREDDLLALYREAAAAAGPRIQPDYAVRENGSETIVGYTGAVWQVHPKDVPSLAAVDMVVSNDSALDTVGRGLAMQTRMLITRNSAMSGGLGNLEKRMIELLEKGTVLRLSSALKLERVDKGPIAPGEFELPKPMLDKAALKVRLANPDPLGASG